MLTAVVLAGGLGTRLRPVVNDRPKPMALVNGIPFLSHLLRFWRKQGVSKFVLSVGYLSEQIIEFFGTEFEGAKILYVIEAEPLGTGGALIHCLAQGHINGPFLLLNGDTFFEVDLEILVKKTFEYGADWGLSLFLTNENDRYQNFESDDDGFLKFAKSDSSARFEHDPKLANGGVYWVNLNSPDIFKAMAPPCSLENDVFAFCEQLGQKFHGVCFNGLFIDIGVPEDYRRAQTMACFREFDR